MWRRIINGQSKSITAAAIIIGSLSLVSRFLGIFRDRILAAEFGASSTLDVYYAAFRLPDLVYSLLILGAVSAGLIPVFTSLISQNKKEESWKLINGVLNLVIMGVILLCGVLWVFAPFVIHIITPGFSGAQMDQVVSLSRIMFLSPVLLGISAIMGSVLQSYRKFFAFSLAPVLYNVGIIIGALYFVPIWGIVGLAWGVVFGSVLHMLIQILPLKILGYYWQPILTLRDHNIKKVLYLMVPRTLTLMVGQLNVVIVTIIASTFAAGSLAIFTLANNLQSFPLGIFSVSLAVAALPVLSALAVQNKKEEIVGVISSTMRQIFFFIVPASIMLYVLRAHVVRIILGSGSFDWQDTRLTAACLAIFALSLFAQGALPLLIRGFYAFHNTKTPFYLGLLSIFTTISGLLFFQWILSFDNWFRFSLLAILKISDLPDVIDVRVLALPLALSGAALCDLILFSAFLRHIIGRLDARKMISSIWRIACAAIGGGLVSYGVLQIIGPNIITETFIGILIQGGISGVFGLLGYIGLAYILQIEELQVIIQSLRKKLLKGANVSEDPRLENI